MLSRWRQWALRPVSALGGRRRLGGIPVEPAAHVVVVELLRPEHPCQCLAEEQRLVVAAAVRGQLRVELVGFALAVGEHLREIAADAGVVVG